MRLVCVQVGFGDVAAAGGGGAAFSQKASFAGFDGSGSQLFGGAKASSRADGGGDDDETGEWCRFVCTELLQCTCTSVVYMYQYVFMP